MSKERAPGPKPEWEDVIDRFLGIVEDDTIPREILFNIFARTMIQLTQQGRLTDLGGLQRYLRQREADVQIAAAPFKPEAHPPLVRCVDPVSHEPRSHFLKTFITDAPEKLSDYLQTEGMSPEVNETLLSRETGFLQVVATLD